jgi:hypothetical protein
MLRILIVLAVVSAAMYLAMSFAIWRRTKLKANQSSESPRPAYLWGFLFAVLFYYGFPLWWWRYGFRKALNLMIVCIGAGVLIQILLGVFGVIKIESLGDSVAIGLVISMPIRAIAGIWVARRDFYWRQAVTVNAPHHQ